MPVRIMGLVRFFNMVKNRLTTGIPEKELPLFLEQIKGVIQQVEDICEQNHITPSQLPSPSRKAYFFLKNLDMDKISQKGVPSSPQTGKQLSSQISIKNIVRQCDYYCHDMWHHAQSYLKNPAEFQDLLENISNICSLVEQLCQNSGVTVANLKQPSRFAYAWFKYLSFPENLNNHLSALQTMQSILPTLNLSHPQVPVEIHFTNMQSYYRARLRRGTYLIKFNEGFINAPRNLMKQLLEKVLTKTQVARPHLQFVHSEEFYGVLYEMESFVDSLDTARGTTYNLEDSFRRVNETYFNGSLPKPRLTWNKLITISKFGHYQSSRDVVMISTSLDHPDVPPYVVDFVMYHELLHKKLGVTIRRGKKIVHSREFRELEKEFSHYQEAMNFLRRWASQQRKYHL